MRVVARLQLAEDLVKGMEQSAFDVPSVCSPPLHHSNKIVHIDIPCLPGRGRSARGASLGWERKRSWSVHTTSSWDARGRCGFRKEVQPMGRAWGIECKLVVRQIGHCFGGRGKEGRRLHPTHRQNEGEAHKGFGARCGWEHDAQFWHIGCINPDSIKAVSDVDLG
jgi:hypothetical protein